MAIVAMSVSDTIRYVSNLDPCKVVKYIPVDDTLPDGPTNRVETVEPGATYFNLAALDVALMGNINDNASSLTGKEGSNEIGIHTKVQQTNIDTVRFGLRGWENFKDSAGNDVKFTSTKLNRGGKSYTVASDDVLNLLGLELIQELAIRIKMLSTVSKELAKN